jgi:hypothetical protein
MDSPAEETEDKSLMMLEEMSNSEFQIDLKAAKSMNRLQVSCDRSSVFKVSNFIKYSSSEKVSMFQYLLHTFKGCLGEITTLEQEIINLKDTLRTQ